jgi:hypothetical protein
MSNYQNLTDSEKILLFNLPYVENFESEKDLKLFLWEKKGYEIIFKLMLKYGGFQNTVKDSVLNRSECYLKKLDLNSSLKNKYYYDTFIKKNKVSKEGTYIKCSFLKEWDEDVKNFTWTEIEKERTGIEIFQLDPYIRSLHRFSISITHLVKEEKSLFSSKKYVEMIKLYPFIENEIFNDEGYIPESDFLNDPRVIEKNPSVLQHSRYVNFWSFIENKDYNNGYLLSENDKEFLVELYNELNDFVLDFSRDIKLSIDRENEIKLNEKTKTIQKVNNLILEEFDKDQNGELDILDCDDVLLDIVEKNQDIIVEIDFKIIKNFVSLNNYIKIKKNNLKRIFEVLQGVEENSQLEIVLEVLRMSIKNYDLLVIHSTNMVVSLLTKDMISYYEIYETFDNLGVFESNWEKEISRKITSIDSKLTDVISSLKQVCNSIYSMEKTISNDMKKLTYYSRKSYDTLNSSVKEELRSISDGIKLNNTLTLFDTIDFF